MADLLHPASASSSYMTSLFSRPSGAEPKPTKFSPYLERKASIEADAYNPKSPVNKFLPPKFGT